MRTGTISPHSPNYTHSRSSFSKFMNRDQIFCNLFRINILYMHLYKSLGILLKANNKQNSVTSFCRSASKLILNDSLLNFGWQTRQLNAESSKLLNYLSISNWMCFLWRYSTRHKRYSIVSHAWPSACTSKGTLHTTRLSMSDFELMV